MSIADLLTHSPTVAVLNARGELSRARAFVSQVAPNEPAWADAIRAELDRLEDLIGDLCDVGRLVESGQMMLASDVEEDYVSKEDFDSEREDREKAEEERDDLRHELDVCETDRDEAQGALEDSEDEVRHKLGEALRRVTALQSEASALRATLARVEKQREALKSPLAPRVHAALYSQSFELTREQRRSAHAVAVHDRYVAGIKAMRAAIEAAVKGETP